MSLAVVVDALADRLSAAAGAGTTVGDVQPTSAQDLPAVTLDLGEVTEQVAGIGRVPRGTRSGALETTIEVDLTDPTLDLGGGESLELVSEDRLSLVLPHGPLVRADGSDDPPFTDTDLDVRDASTWEVVATPPTGRQVRPDVGAGVLRFGQALPAEGTLRVGFHIGRWDVVVSRYQGLLGVRVAAEASAHAALVRRIAADLARQEPGVRIVPRTWGSAGPPAGDLPAQTRTQLLQFHIDTEVEQPLLGSGGGVITVVAAALHADENGTTRTETFDIARTP